MSGHVIIIDRYTRELITANPQVLFAFGDNLLRVGHGGQAAAARGCPNAVGIPTKWSPAACFSDEELDDPLVRFPVHIAIVQAFGTLRQHLRSGGTIVWPQDGVGTGLASLPTKAPRLLKAIEGVKEKVFSEASSVVHQTLQSIEQRKI